MASRLEKKGMLESVRSAMLPSPKTNRVRSSVQYGAYLIVGLGLSLGIREMTTSTNNEVSAVMARTTIAPPSNIPSEEILSSHMMHSGTFTIIHSETGIQQNVDLTVYKIHDDVWIKSQGGLWKLEIPMKTDPSETEKWLIDASQSQAKNITPDSKGGAEASFYGIPAWIEPDSLEAGFVSLRPPKDTKYGEGMRSELDMNVHIGCRQFGKKIALKCKMHGVRLQDASSHDSIKHAYARASTHSN